MAAGTRRLPPVSPESYDAWWDFSYEHGTNIAALAEAIGRELAKAVHTPTNALPPLLRRAVLDAQRIERERSSRKR